MKRTGFLVTSKKNPNQTRKKPGPYLAEKGCSHPLNVNKVAKLLYVVLKSNHVDIIFPLCLVQFC